MILMLTFYRNRQIINASDLLSKENLPFELEIAQILN